MTNRRVVVGVSVFVLPLAFAVALVAVSNAQAPLREREQLREPIYRIASSPAPQTDRLPEQRREHPLMPAIRLAHEGQQRLSQIHDYTCTMVKREQVNGKLLDHEYMFAKIRNERIENGRVVVPFSVYLYFLAPENVKGREVLYVRGKNNGNLIARDAGKIRGLITVSLDPESALAMAGNRYPITEIGLRTLVDRLIERAEEDLQHDDVVVRFFEGAKINNRECTCLEVVHPEYRQSAKFHIARIFIDKEMQIPVRYVSYDWPKTPGGQPELIEEYTYLNVKLNVGLTDADFDRNNPNYSFR